MLLNETFFGLVLHKQLKGVQGFTYPEERPGYESPEQFQPGYKSRQRRTSPAPTSDTSSADTAEEGPGHVAKKEANVEHEGPPTSMTEPDPYIVDWDGPNDVDNPLSWPRWKKIMFTAQLMLLTTSVYMGSSIVTPGIPLLAEYFGVGRVTATLALTLFVVAYGIGPM